jgi:hypothetical protein
MKKMILLCVAMLSMGVAMAQDKFYENSAFTSNSGAKPEVKAVLNYDKKLIMGYTITFNYPVEDMEKAIIERLEKEGVEGNKKKSFYAFKGIKYNYLWNKTFDMYMGFTGSKNAGTINVLLSQGYDNFIVPTEDSITTTKMFEWLTSLDLDVQNFQYNRSMEAHQEEYEDIDKELSKLEKKRESIEKKIRKNTDAQLKFEASRTIITDNELNVNTKALEKEQKKAQQLNEERTQLEGELHKIMQDIANVRTDLNKKTNAIDDLKKEKPLSNQLKK